MLNETLGWCDNTFNDDCGDADTESDIIHKPTVSAWSCVDNLILKRTQHGNPSISFTILLFVGIIIAHVSAVDYSPTLHSL